MLIITKVLSFKSISLTASNVELPSNNMVITHSTLLAASLPKNRVNISERRKIHATKNVLRAWSNFDRSRKTFCFFKQVVYRLLASVTNCYVISTSDLLISNCKFQKQKMRNLLPRCDAIGKPISPKPIKAIFFCADMAMNIVDRVVGTNK